MIPINPSQLSWIVFGLILSVWMPQPMRAEGMKNRVKEAIEILEAKQNSPSPIPAMVRNKAKGIAIVEITKGGLGVGASLGEGIVLARTDKGWSAPCAFSMGEGSVGLQIGVEIRRFIFVLNSQRALKMFTSDQKTVFDAKASATGGPSQAGEGTALLPESEIYVHSTSEGAFAGASIGGMGIMVDMDVNRSAYGKEVDKESILTWRVKPPEYANRLYELLNSTEPTPPKKN